ncbi:hypothetical protein HN51_063680 [Arachis hypogaea]
MYADSTVGYIGNQASEAKHKSAIKKDEHGTLVSANSVGIYHDHFYIYHLDLDIDGVENSFGQTNLKTVRVTDGSSKRKSYWTVDTKTANTESDGNMKTSQ